ncbi:unnamed protein product [Vitrella brassicaformis CCMP3155]|uniref:Potassium channel tetramerisation-type BTB domain-containing protein n=3 Tax=Vitrella brassicaformis TaxID=1169539 RepID=A0A0G4GJ19_VITBC|nr:unnamed protein product [Vitrella brassicaformis CCMP3155]|eukprot:CEM29773.1 unnamed protein product [Vitrella brassicaformis CCMP3155]
MKSSPATAATEGSSSHDSEKQQMKINVGGRVIGFPVGALLRSEWQQSCLSVLLHRFPMWLLTDDNDVPFIDADPEFFIRLAGLLSGVPGSSFLRSDFPDYRLRFLAPTLMSTDNKAPSSEGKAAVAGFMALVGPFIKADCGGRGGREVKTMIFTDSGVGTCVCAVSTTDATLEHFELLDHQFKWFSTTDSRSAGETVEQFHKRVTHFQKVVDWARRIRMSGDGGVEDSDLPYPPFSDDPRGLADMCEMYGVFEQAYRCVLGKTYNIRHRHTSFPRKEDAVSYADLMSYLGGGGGGGVGERLMVIETNDAQRLLCHIDGPLPLRTDSTFPQLTGRKVTFHRMTMKAGEKRIVTTEVPPEDDGQHDHFVIAAGVHGGVTGVVKATNDETVKGRVALAGGRLWLGVGKDDDMRKCRVCLLPSAEETQQRTAQLRNGADSFRGTGVTFGRARCIEFYEVWSDEVAPPILPEVQFKELVSVASEGKASAHLLYKARRDGWSHETMMAKVGEGSTLLQADKYPRTVFSEFDVKATPLLLVVKRTDTHKLACLLDHPTSPFRVHRSPLGCSTSIEHMMRWGVVLAKSRPGRDPATFEINCPVTFFSTRKDEGITPVEVPQHDWIVELAGPEDAVVDMVGCAMVGRPTGSVAIAGGRLWLGYATNGLLARDGVVSPADGEAVTGPAGDLRRVCHFVWPHTTRMVCPEESWGDAMAVNPFIISKWESLVGCVDFTADDIEIYAMQKRQVRPVGKDAAVNKLRTASDGNSTPALSSPSSSTDPPAIPASVANRDRLHKRIIETVSALEKHGVSVRLRSTQDLTEGEGCMYEGRDISYQKEPQADVEALYRAVKTLTTSWRTQKMIRYVDLVLDNVVHHLARVPGPRRHLCVQLPLEERVEMIQGMLRNLSNGELEKEYHTALSLHFCCATEADQREMEQHIKEYRDLSGQEWLAELSWRVEQHLEQLTDRARKFHIILQGAVAELARPSGAEQPHGHFQPDVQECSENVQVQQQQQQQGMMPSGPSASPPSLSPADTSDHHQQQQQQQQEDGEQGGAGRGWHLPLMDLLLQLEREYLTLMDLQFIDQGDSQEIEEHIKRINHDAGCLERLVRISHNVERHLTWLLQRVRRLHGTT